MPPKKIVEKARVKPPQVKEPKGVRTRQNAPTVPPKRRRKTSLDANTCNDAPTSLPKTKPKAAPKRKKNEQILIEDAGTSPPLNVSLNKTKSPQMTSKNESEPTIEDFNNCFMPVTSSRSKGNSKQKEDIPEIKIMLANDVVRTAFQKKPIINIDLTYPPPCEETKAKPKRGRPKQTSVKLLDYVTNTNSVPANSKGNDETIQAVAKKKLVKCGPKKRPANTDDTFVDGEPQSGTIIYDLTGDIETPKKKKILSLRRIKDTDSPTETKDTRVLRKTGKDDCETSTNIVTASESPLNCVPETNGNVQSDENKVGGRKFSVTSISTSLSWTKDISSSSAHSVVTVQPDDFVRIDKKLPIIKLTNIDHITPKDKNDNIFDDENSLDNRKDRTSECNTYVSSLDLNVSQTLNLSTSSLTSVTTNRTQNGATGKAIINKNNNVVSKLRRSLDNLSLKMKSFDLEMIDWIGYNNEIKDETSVEYHKRVFDLLKEENEIIKYCREIKKVLTGEVDAQHTEKETNKIEEAQARRNPTNLTREPNITDVISTQFDASNKVEKSTTLIGFETQNNNDHTDINKDNNTETPKSNNTTDQCADGKTPVQTNTSATSQVHDHAEDDDAISLFAESITCLETSKRNSSYARRSLDAVNTEENNASTDRHPRERNPPNDNLDDFEDGEHSRGEEPPTRSPNNGIRENRKIDLSGLRHINHERSILDTPINNDKGTSNIFNKLNFADNTHKVIESASNKDIMPVFKMPVSFAKKFGDFQNIQIKVPLRADVSPNRKYELVGTNKSPTTTTKININKTPVTETNSSNRINTVNIESSTTLGADSTSFLSANEQLKSQSSNLTPKQTPQFKGTKIFTCCIFNLFRKCKKTNCTFPHVALEEDSLASKLMELNEAEFEKECTYVLSWPMLMIKYGMCYVKECIRRELTRLLLRFNVGFVSSIHNPTPVIEVVETTLLYLNDVELEPFRDILQWRVGSDALLCDYYMEVISETQNFSRFKSVFIKLTMFICAVGGTFSSSVATQLLERVCILGYEDVLAAALIRIIKNAAPEIFSVPMMASFERRLCSNNTQLYEELVGFKVQLGLQSVGGQSLGVGEVLSPCRTPAVNSTPAVTSTPIVNRTPASSDASKDSTSNSSEPVITRTIEFNRNIKMAALNMTSGSDTSEEPVKNTFEPRIMQQRWRNHPPGFFPLRPQRKMFQRRFPPRAYNHIHPKFRRPPPPSGC